MSKELKYTSDGKKVVVVGSLNSQEKIVQEIFMVDGSEIPSGEHFTVKSLHDSPVVSWKESELKKLEERFERERKNYLLDIEKNEKQYIEKTKELRAKINYIAKVLKNANESSFTTLVDFITGEIGWIVISGYDPEIVNFKDFNQMYEDKLRLFSLFGKDDGSFTYAVGQYYDYSGGSKEFFPFKNYDDAFSKFKDILLSKGVDDRSIKIAEKYKISFPREKVEEYKKKKIDSFSGHIKDYLKKIDEWEKLIVEISNL
jgi:hypothetical protein